MSSYKDLLAQRKILEQQIEEAKAREYNQVLEDVKQKISDYGFSIQELGISLRGRSNKGSRLRGSVPPKYKDPISGSTWSGRGKPPRWIVDKNREDFLI